MQATHRCSQVSVGSGMKSGIGFGSQQAPFGVLYWISPDNPINQVINVNGFSSCVFHFMCLLSRVSDWANYSSITQTRLGSKLANSRKRLARIVARFGNYAPLQTCCQKTILGFIICLLSVFAPLSLANTCCVWYACRSKSKISTNSFLSPQKVAK